METPPSLAEAMAAGPVLLDGGLATQLEAQGHDLSSSLWSARLLAEDPEAIVTAHRAYLDAGAQVITTASYQASFPGFARAGIDQPRAEQLIRDSVALADRARSEVEGGRWIAGSVGPYGASLADGSEYRGDYGLTVAQLREWHRPRMAVLADAGVDVLAVETIPCLTEVEAVLAEVAALGVPAWLSLTVAGDRTRAGEPAAEAYAMAGSVDAVVAVGINCSDPRDAAVMVPVAAASGKPVVVYPNSGEDWDAAARTWVGNGQFDPLAVRAWVAAGARLVGGCCRVGPGQIHDLGAVIAVAPGA